MSYETVFTSGDQDTDDFPRFTREVTTVTTVTLTIFTWDGLQGITDAYGRLREEMGHDFHADEVTVTADNDTITFSYSVYA